MIECFMWLMIPMFWMLLLAVHGLCLMLCTLSLMLLLLVVLLVHYLVNSVPDNDDARSHST